MQATALPNFLFALPCPPTKIVAGYVDERMLS